MKKTKILVFALAFVASVAQAATLQFTLNTSSIAGTNGSVDFQFNPGGASSQAASVMLYNFAGGSNAGVVQGIGSVSGGPIPNPITINNTNSANDAFETITFGNSLSFLANFTGPAVTSPNGISTASSQFTFSLFKDAAGTMPVLTPDLNGIAGTATVNLNGTLSSSAVSPSLTITSVPEPGSFGMAAGALLIAFGISRLPRNGYAKGSAQGRRFIRA
jgi:hypothetical protein